MKQNQNNSALVPAQTLDVAKQLNQSVFQVLGEESLQGFEKAYLIASAAGELKKLLTDEYMRPILDLQGNRLGFKTDKDSNGGYPKEVVKNCLIEAVLTGVQPFGNQFNIIAGNCYITKEGFGYLLKNIKGLQYEIIPELPRIKDQSAAVVMNIEWTINSITKKKGLDIPVKVNQYMGADAVIGKATRKARCWLFNTITGNEIADGDITDVEGVVIKTTVRGSEEIANDKETTRILDFIETVKNEQQLLEVEPHLFNDELKETYNRKKASFNGKLL